MPVTIAANGPFQTLDVDADMPIRWELRDVLGISETRFGCGVAF